MVRYDEILFAESSETHESLLEGCTWCSNKRTLKYYENLTRARTQVPDALRSSVWPILVGVHSSMRLENNKMETLSKGKTYEEHLASGSDPKNFTDMSRPGGTIDRDLSRTYFLKNIQL